MKIFTPEKIKTEEDKRKNLLLWENEQLERQIKEKREYLPKVKELEADLTHFAQEIQVKKDKLLKELHQVQVSLEKKKDLFYQLIEKQDKVEERERAVTEREEIVRRRESLVSQIEQKLQHV